MKLVQATFVPFKLDAITDAVRAAGASGMSISESMQLTRSGSKEHRVACLTLETVVHDDLAERVVAAIARASRSGPSTDGMIVVMPVASALAIRTGAIDEAAVWA